jgi:3-hydroxyacyl-[acyl-carrier-protein] dehydratase
MEKFSRDPKKFIDTKEIQKIIPHRYPMLLVDRIISVDDKTVTGLKNVTVNEAFFQGHFPSFPVMPGVLIIEAMAQTGGAYALSQEQFKGKFVLFAGIDNARFRKPVVPGDQLIMEITFLKMRSSVIQVHGVAKVLDEIAAEADMMFAITSGEG